MNIYMRVQMALKIHEWEEIIPSIAGQQLILSLRWRPEPGKLGFHVTEVKTFYFKFYKHVRIREEGDGGLSRWR